MTKATDPLFSVGVQFGANSKNLPENYNTNFDADLAERVAETLPSYLEQFAKEHSVEVQIVREQNLVTIERSDGSKLELKCFGPDVHDMTRWPSSDEIVATMNPGFEKACGMDDDEMITLMRCYIVEGNWGSQRPSLVEE